MMIKVNLSPNRKRRKTASGGKKKVETQTSPGSVVLGIFALGWGGRSIKNRSTPRRKKPRPLG
jgi:hypothetical protein